MFGHKKPHIHKTAKQNSVDPPKSTYPQYSIPMMKLQKVNPKTVKQNFILVFIDPKFKNKSFDDHDVKGTSYASKNKSKNDFVDYGGIENQNVQELKHYAAYKAEETTKAVNSALKIAEDIREGATNTMITLHQQGEQINRTHMAAADIEQDLSRGEKLLGSLGGIFSRTWKPKKGQTIKGPTTFRDDPNWKKGNHLKQREKLGTYNHPK